MILREKHLFTSPIKKMPDERLLLSWRVTIKRNDDVNFFSGECMFNGNLKHFVYKMVTK